MKKGERLYERNVDQSWRHHVHRCPDCDKLTAYTMPIVIGIERCYNPKCERPGLKHSK